MATFSEALEAMKQGKRVTRADWNGKDMWIAVGGMPVELEAEKFWNKHSRAFAEQNGGKAIVEPYFIMKTAQGAIQMGWLATQSDLLSEKWEILPDDLAQTA